MKSVSRLKQRKRKKRMQDLKQKGDDCYSCVVVSFATNQHTDRNLWELPISYHISSLNGPACTAPSLHHTNIATS
ncbi:putative coiled-coil domain-containing protein [Sesbania bispinosa]|nr:putative coiled-coil domain-containing protein [Sesbania bispinosa]